VASIYYSLSQCQELVGERGDILKKQAPFVVPILS
jgi:hypothetical protein